MPAPVIDVIDDETLEFMYDEAAGTSVGGFDWSLEVVTSLDAGMGFRAVLTMVLSGCKRSGLFLTLVFIGCCSFIRLSTL